MSEVVEESDVEVVDPADSPEVVPTFAAADDPRAMAGIRRAKGFGGLIGFALTGFAAHMHGELMSSVLLRALAGGLAGYMVAWLAAVTVWRRIIRAEFQRGVEAMKQRRAAMQTEVQP
jgi:hypothetical protein